MTEMTEELVARFLGLSPDPAGWPKPLLTILLDFSKHVPERVWLDTIRSVGNNWRSVLEIQRRLAPKAGDAG